MPSPSPSEVTAACWSDLLPASAAGALHRPAAEFPAEDRRWMEEALHLARAHLGATWPNPTVGCVIVRDGRVIGRGFHPRAGAEHAEIMALREAGEGARGATLYVTLEPCSHHGRTPPCTAAIIRAGVRRVVVAVPDPHPRVRGKGLAQLLEAGIRVEVGAKAAEAFRVNEPFFHHAARGRPWVLFKAAVSLDGKIATRTGHSRWITGAAARRRVHGLRRELPAIMVGVGTVLADDPRLTARTEEGAPEARQPLRVVVDSDARIPPTARLLAEPGETLIACGEGCPKDRIAALEAAGARVEMLPRSPDGRVSLPALMDVLGRRSVVGVLLEGGGTLAGAMLDESLIHEVVFHVAPVLIGGSGPSPVQGQGASRMDEAWRLHDVEWRPLAEDLEVRGTLHAPAARRCRSYFEGGRE